MRYKTLFRVLLKAIGVWLVVAGLESLITAGGELYYILAQSAWQSVQAYWVTSRFALAALKLSFGAYLFFGGAWVANLAIPGNRPYCAECGYDLSQARAGSCPECGATRPSSESL